MKLLIITPEAADQIRTLNTTSDPSRQLCPMALEDGRQILNADLLTDCAPGQTWEDYSEVLQTAELFEL